MKPSVIFSTRNALFAIVLSCLLATFACAGGGSGSGGGGAKLSSIKVSAANANPTVGDTVQLTATGKYNNGSTQDLTSQVTWATSPAGLATVGAGGVLTATASGAVSVTAAMGGVSGSASVTIAPKLISIAITPASKTIAKATKQQFVATGTYSDNSTQPITSTVSWTSSNPAAATISDTNPTKGLALGVAAGTTNITATSGSITSNTAVLTVTSASATSLAITGPANMALDVSQQFTAVATFTDSTTQDVTNVSTWSSGSTSVATVTVSGLVTAKNLGTTNISASFESASDSSSLTVDASNLTSIDITAADNKTFIAQGTKIPITATGHFNNGSTSNLSTRVTWSSSDTSVAQFVSVNQLSGLKPGSITITAKLGSITASVPFDITNATIQSITVTPVNQTIPIGWHQQFSATGKFSDASTQDITTSVGWSAGTPTMANFGTAGSSAGVILGIKQGTTNVAASFSSVTGNTSLTVSSATLSSISVSTAKPNPIIAPGATLPFNAKGKWSDGSTQNVNVYVTWSSSDPNVATVGVSGVVTGQSEGPDTITATLSGKSASESLVVEGSNLVSIKITPQSLKLPATIETQLTATGLFENGKQLDLTSAVTWTSSTPSVATVSNSADTAGIATGVAQGNTTVSASFAGISATTPLTITVTNATLTSISVTPSARNIPLGSSQLFAAQGTFTDNSMVNITVEVVWSSSDVAVATIKANGLATSASTGTTTIKAALNGVSGTAVLTVH